TLSPAGLLSGTPTAAGTSTVTVRVADKRGGQDVRALRIDVNDPGAVDWPSWMSDLAGAGANLSESAISPDSVGGLATAWSRDVTPQAGDAQEVRGLVVAGSTVYVTSRAGTLTALATNNGSPQWQKTGLGDLNSAPTVAGDTVYVVSPLLGQLVAYPTSGGTKRWSADVPLFSNNGSGVDPAPVVAGNLAYVAGGDGRVYAFHTSDGSPAWNAPVDDPASEGPITGTPAIDEGRLFFGTGCDLYAVDAATGNRLWRATYSDSLSCEYWVSPTVTGGAVVYSGPFTGPTAFDAATGHVLWSHSFNPRQTSSGLSAAYGAVYGSTNLFNGAGDIYRLVAFDVATGDVDFSTPIGCYCRNPPTVANGMVFLQENQAVSVYDADTGDPLTSSPTFGTGAQTYATPVAVAAGRLFAGADDGTVIAFHT
ncbi:MAG TPA: PQQ-binding-like beta-propeller repeat protein, partial [Actinomycetota bacterium]|nr:PQQ-binding-like beta-propeller repeat protein [Actinomycetota bacterium]